jgi:hypothetical protein
MIKNDNYSSIFIVQFTNSTERLWYFYRSLFLSLDALIVNNSSMN